MISEQIRLLLFKNDCVVIPGLGGFILNHLPAAYDEKDKRFYPARALPFFNKQLQSNDGLLAAALVNQEKYDYNSALKEINRFVEQVKDTLSDKREYAMPGLGEFKQNQEGQITFFPDKNTNADRETYGLDSLKIEPLVKPKQIQRKAMAPIRKKSIGWITMAASLALIILGGWIINNAVDTPFGKQWGILNPFGHSYHSNAPISNPENDAAPEESANSPEEEVDMTKDMPEAVTQAPEVDYTKNIETEQVQTEEFNPSASSTDSVYYIVIGAFKNYKNAERLEKKIKHEGYSACTYQAQEGDWIRVCAERHTQRFEAEERLGFIRSSANSKAWILAVANDIH